MASENGRFVSTVYRFWRALGASLQDVKMRMDQGGSLRGSNMRHFFIFCVGMFAFFARGQASVLPIKRTSGPSPESPVMKVELYWAEFKPVAGLTRDKGVPFGEEGSSLIYLHKKAALSNEDIGEARVDGEVSAGNGAAGKLYGVKMYLTKEGKQNLGRSGESGKKKVLVTVLDGREGSAFYVDVANLKNFVQPIGFFQKDQAEQLVNKINKSLPPVPAKK